MAQVTSYQRGSLSFTTTQQNAGTAQTVFTNSSASPMRVINVGCNQWNNGGGGYSANAFGFFIRHNGNTGIATMAMLNYVQNGNGIGGSEMPPGGMSSKPGLWSPGGATSGNSTADGMVVGTLNGAVPIGADGNYWVQTGAWYGAYEGFRNFATGSTSAFGVYQFNPAGFWMSPGDVLVCKSFIGSGSASGFASNVAYNFITVTDSGS